MTLQSLPSASSALAIFLTQTFAVYNLFHLEINASTYSSATCASMWITNGTLTGKETGDLFLVYARTGSEKRTDITQFIVEGCMKGFPVGQKINDKLGMRGKLEL